MIVGATHFQYLSVLYELLAKRRGEKCECGEHTRGDFDPSRIAFSHASRLRTPWHANRGQIDVE